MPLRRTSIDVRLEAPSVMRFRSALVALALLAGTSTAHAQAIDVSTLLKPSVSLSDSAVVGASPFRLMAQPDSEIPAWYQQLLKRKTNTPYTTTPAPDCVLPDEAIIAPIEKPMQDRMPVLEAPEQVDPGMIVDPCTLQPNRLNPRN